MFSYNTAKLKKNCSEVNNSLWLITCSDLFFLLFAFFVLNHSLVSEKKIIKKLKAPLHKIGEVASNLATVHYSNATGFVGNLQANFYYEINSKWFSNDGEPSIFGKMQISSIEKIINSTKTSIKIILELPPKVEGVESMEIVNKVRALLKTISRENSPMLVKVNSQFEDVRIGVALEF